MPHAPKQRKTAIAISTSFLVIGKNRQTLKQGTILNYFVEACSEITFAPTLS